MASYSIIARMKENMAYDWYLLFKNIWALFPQCSLFKRCNKAFFYFSKGAIVYKRWPMWSLFLTLPSSDINPAWAYFGFSPCSKHLIVCSVLTLEITFVLCATRVGSLLVTFLSQFVFCLMQWSMCSCVHALCSCFKINQINHAPVQSVAIGWLQKAFLPSHHSCYLQMEFMSLWLRHWKSRKHGYSRHLEATEDNRLFKSTKCKLAALSQFLINTEKTKWSSSLEEEQLSVPQWLGFHLLFSVVFFSSVSVVSALCLC